MCEPDDDGGEYEEEEEKQSYILRKLMFIPMQEEDNQHHKLFQIQCIVGSHSFDIIIDSRSCENIITKGVVEALKLLIEPYANP